MTEFKFKRTGKFIRENRLKADLQQTEVAFALRCRSQFIANWERGISSPPKEKVKKLCDLLKVTKKSLVNQIAQDYTDRYFKGL